MTTKLPDVLDACIKYSMAIKGQDVLNFCIKYGPTVVLGFLGLFLWYAYYVYQLWEHHFARRRVGRRMKNSPSNRQHPDIKTYEHNRKQILEASKKHPSNFENCELLDPLKKNVTVKKHSRVVRDTSRTGSLTPVTAAEAKRIAAELVGVNENSVGDVVSSVKASVKTKGSLSNEKAEELDMDHVYLSYPEFLWAYCFIGPNSYYLWIKGVTILWIRVQLQTWGIIRPKPYDPTEIVGRLCLEGTLAVHYYARTDKDSNLGDIAGFFFRDFPYIDENCQPRVADLFAVDIDLKTKRMFKAKFDDETLTASQALTLLWFNTISGNHVKLHALANWGVNNEPEVKEVNPFLAQNSLVTVIYNFFGFSCFSHYIPTWVNWGLMSPQWTPQAIVDVFKHGVKDNIWAHPNIEELAGSSRFVKFVIKCRAMFLKEFAIHRLDFPGVHGEAMFVGTVLHSLDHTTMDWNLEDPLWLDVTDARFGLMAELGRIVKVGFVKDVPGLQFHKRFKGSNHPFYQSVYEKAAKIDKDYADNMDTCIIK